MMTHRFTAAAQDNNVALNPAADLLLLVKATGGIYDTDAEAIMGLMGYDAETYEMAVDALLDLGWVTAGIGTLTSAWLQVSETA